MNILVTLCTSTSIQSLVKIRIVDVNLVRIDSNNRTCHKSDTVISHCSRRSTIFLVHALNLIEELSLLNDIPVEFICFSGSSNLGSWEFCQRVEIQVVDHRPCDVQDPCS